MKYTRNILLLMMASMTWTLNAKNVSEQGSNHPKQIVINNDNEDDVADSELPEGMTDREIDSLLNEWAVKTYLEEEACDPSSTNPEFPKEVYVDRLSRIQSRVELPYNDVVRKYIDRYTDRMRRSVSVMLGASNFYTPIFEEALDSYQLPLELKYLPVIESALNPGATSKAGAAGLWQFTIGTGKKYNLEVTSLIDERRDPIKSSYAAAHFLKDLYTIFGDWTLCIAAYNCGPGNVNKAIKRAGGEKDFWTIYPYLPQETRGYVPAFIAATYVMNYYCDHNICPVNTRLPMACDTIIVTRDLHMEQIVKATGIDMEELKALNPQYRTQIIPGNSHECTLKMPSTAVNAFLEAGEDVYSYRKGELLTKRREVAINEDAKEQNGVTKKTEKEETIKPVKVVEEKKETKKEEKKEVAKREEKKEVAKKEEKKEVKKDDKKDRKKDDKKDRKKDDKKDNKKDRKNDDKKDDKKSKKGNKSVTVKEGDTLSGIARKNGTTVDQLKKANGLKGDMIKPGQEIKVK